MPNKPVFLDSDDEINIVILDKRVVDDDNPDGTPISFIDIGIEKMIAYRFDNDAVIADSSVDDKISYNNEGEIKLKLGSVDKFSIAKNRNYDTYIKAFSPSKPKGQTIVHNKYPDSNLSITFN